MRPAPYTLYFVLRTLDSPGSTVTLYIVLCTLRVVTLCSVDFVRLDLRRQELSAASAAALDRGAASRLARLPAARRLVDGGGEQICPAHLRAATEMR